MLPIEYLLDHRSIDEAKVNRGMNQVAWSGKDPSICYKNEGTGAEEMARWLRAPAVLAEDWGLNPSIHIAANNCP